MRKSLVVIVFVAIAAVFIVIGFVRKGKSKAERCIAVIPKATTHIFWQSVRAGALKAGEEAGVKILWSGPERETDRERQIQIIEDFLVRKVIGIVLAPNDENALVPSVEKIFARNIPCAIIDSGINTDKYVCFAATDNYQGGVIAARRMGEILGGKGRVIVIKYVQNHDSTTNRENGFIDMRIEENIKFVSGDKVNLEMFISEGERFRIGQINITGNEETQDKVVRHVLDEYDFKPGQWYNADIARGDGNGYLERLIQRSVLTEAAIITPTGVTPGQRDAQVSIVEGQTGSVMLGAGVGSDSGVIGQLVFDQRNFDIHDLPENFGEFITGKAFKGAGQALRIAFQPGTDVSQYSISFTEPYLNDKPVSLDVIGSSYERWQESYDEKRTKGYVGFEKREKNRWRKSIGFRVENVEVDDIDPNAPQEIKDVAGNNLLAGVKVGFGRDLTDDKFMPSAGYSFNVSYEQVDGDHSFGIARGVHRGYKTLYEDLSERKTVLATKLLGAAIVGDAPAFEKFYGGGTGLYGIRGFDYRGVSPRGLQTNVMNAERKDPIGSDWIFIASAEVVVPLVSDNFGALFFVDSGMVETGGYRAAIGTGIQILLPQWFGPIPMRFELSAPFMKDDSDDEQVFSFSVGRLF